MNTITCITIHDFPYLQTAEITIITWRRLAHPGRNWQTEEHTLYRLLGNVFELCVGNLPSMHYGRRLYNVDRAIEFKFPPTFPVLIRESNAARFLVFSYLSP